MQFNRESPSLMANAEPVGNLGAADAMALLALSPAATALVDNGGQLLWANGAAVSLLAGGEPLAAGQSMAVAMGLTAASTASLQAVLDAGAGAVELMVDNRVAGSMILRLNSCRLPLGAHLLVLTADPALAAARAEIERLRERIDVVQELGQVAAWERDAQTLDGHWDRRLFEFWGLDPALGAPHFDAATQVIVEPDRARLAAAFTASLSQPGRYAHDYRVRAPSGSLRHVHSRWRVVAGADGSAARVIGVVMDDTRAWELARSLDQVESQLSLAMAIADITVWRHDLQTQRVHYNAQGYAFLGIAPRPDGLSIEEANACVHPDDLPQVLASACAALNSRRPDDLESRYRSADGRWRSVLMRRVVQRDALGEPVAFLGVALDVTERRATELALRGADERALLAARGVGLGTWEVDLRSGRSHWDEAMWTLRGMSPRAEPLTGAEWLALVHPDDRAEVSRCYSESLHQDSAANYEFRIVRADGSLRWLASRSAPLRDELGRIVRRIGVNWDVTDRRTADAQRQQHEIAARESQAKSRLLARMSHELRTPLNAVLGFTQLLLADERASDTASQRLRRLEHVQTAGQQLLALIDQLLELSGLDSGAAPIERAPVALAPLARQTLALLAPALQNHSVRLQLGEFDGEVLSESTRLRQLLVILLSHAISHSRIDGDVHLGAARDGDAVVLSVSDSGRGLSAAQLAQAFEPFNGLGADSDGLGLAIAKASAERLGASLTLRSQLGVGSVFELRLPAAGMAPSPGRATLLYIEDNPVNAMIVSELIATRPALRLHVAVDGASGVALARQLQPDLVLLDMQLPDFDGFEVLRQLRADPSTAAIRCIALSANALPVEIERALQAGMDGYWTKPLDFKVFMAAIDAMFGAG